MTRTLVTAGMVVYAWMNLSPPVEAGSSAEIASAFDAKLKETSVGVRGVFEIWSAAKAFAAEHGPEAVPHLTQRAAKAWSPRNSSRFVLLTLAALSVDDRALGFLRDRSLQEEKACGEAIFAVSFMPPERARPILERVLLESKNRAARGMAASLLVWSGDEGTLARLRRARPDAAAKPDVDTAADALAQWLKRFPDEKVRRDWARQEVNFLQAFRGAPPLRSIESAYAFAVRDLARHGVTFSAAFLKTKLGSTGPDGKWVAGEPAATSIAAGLAAVQKEETLVPVLARCAASWGIAGGACRGALGRIGTDASLRALEGLITHDRSRNRDQDNVNRQAAGLLAHCGDAGSLARLRALAEDERFSEDERRVFRNAAETIQRRLRSAR